MTRIQVRRGTAAQWTDADPVLFAGEIGFETDTSKVKLGDGVTTWTQLQYISLTWATLIGKPAYIAAGASAADARAAIGAEPEIVSGTTSQYLRGDKSWQALDKSAVGLGDVDNTSDVSKPISTATQTALDGKSDTGHGHVTADISGLDTELSSIDSDISSITSDISGINAALDGKEPSIFAGAQNQYWRGDKTFQNLDKDAIGLGDVDNTADANKPISTATQAALDGKEDAANKGQAGGYASLDSGGKVPVAQLPSSIMQYQGTWDASTNSPALADGTGNAGDVYRVGTGGSQNLGSGSIAFDVGDYAIYNGTNWEKSDTTDAVASVNGYTGVVSISKSDVGLGSVDNTSDASKPISTATQTALDAKEPTINAGSSGQYWAGDKSWQTLNKAAVGLANVDDTSDSAKNAATATLTNKTISGTSNTISDVSVASLSVTGTASSSTYLRGDGSWATVSAGISTGKAIAMAMVFG